MSSHFLEHLRGNFGIKTLKRKREDNLGPAESSNTSSSCDSSSSSEVDSDEHTTEWSESDEFAAEEYQEKNHARKISPRKVPRSPRKAPVAVKVASKASILSLASDTVPGSQNANDRLADIDGAVLGKIKKALALGGHIGTGEAEAKRAMRLAAKLMAQHNVDQADILAAEDDSDKLKRAGQSTVTIKNTNTKQGVVIHSWSSVAVHAVDRFFDCKSYSTSFAHRVDWTFYGLSEQTVAAAYAFEMVYNLILVWSAQNKTAKGRTGKNNYCHGVARGLVNLAKEEQLSEERRVVKKEAMRLESARRAEEAERARAKGRLGGSGSLGEGSNAQIKTEVKEESTDRKVKIEEVPDDDLVQDHGSSAFENVKPHMDTGLNLSIDDDGDDDDDDVIMGFNADNLEDDSKVKADFDGDEDLGHMLEDLDNGFKRPDDMDQKDSVLTSRAPLSFSSVKVEDVEDTPWSSAQQLTLFRKNASSIADDYEKSKLKLKKGRKRAGPRLESRQDKEVYNQGKRDARKIDVKRKRIKGIDED